MKKLNRAAVESKSYSNKIIQFGEGNFLRAFVNWMVHTMNQQAGFDAGVVVIQPIKHGLVDMLNEQDGLYTVNLNGIKNGTPLNEYELIDCIQQGINPYSDYDAYLKLAKDPNFRFVVSNTTEAGITYNANDTLADSPPISFPAKLTALLHKRFVHFNGASDKGFIFLPCELIDKNGENLKRIILKYANDWQLGDAFVHWIENDNVFCNTLVDRIVSGYPKNRIEKIHQTLGYQDNLVVEGEQFHLWVIEGLGAFEKEIPAEACGLNIIFTQDLTPYRTRKVRILNGAHTSLVPVGYLYGIDKVRESVQDPVVGTFIQEAIAENICPTLDFPANELTQFSNDVLDRFRNPFLDHQLISISLNSVSKYKTRVLPSVLKYIETKNELPKHLLFSLAALVVFYSGNRNGNRIELKDDKEVLDFFKNQWEGSDINAIVKTTLSNTAFWEVDLTSYKGVLDFVQNKVADIVTLGMKKALENFLKS